MHVKALKYDHRQMFLAQNFGPFHPLCDPTANSHVFSRFHKIRRRLGSSPRATGRPVPIRRANRTSNFRCGLRLLSKIDSIQKTELFRKTVFYWAHKISVFVSEHPKQTRFQTLAWLIVFFLRNIILLFLVIVLWWYKKGGVPRRKRNPTKPSGSLPN